MRTYFVGERFACDECDKSFAQKKNLSTHKKEVHQRSRPFGCQQCDASFVSADKLKIHSFTHTGNQILPGYLWKIGPIF